MDFAVGELVGLTGTSRFLKILGIDIEAPEPVYWCKACPGTKYFTLFARDIRKLT